MNREDRETWDQLDDEERLETYASVIDERNALRRPMAAVYERFRHLDCVMEMVGNSDGTANTDPFHAAARDMWRAVKESLGVAANVKLRV